MGINNGRAIVRKMPETTSHTMVNQFYDDVKVKCSIMLCLLTSFGWRPSIAGLVLILEFTASSFIERNYKIKFKKYKSRFNFNRIERKKNSLELAISTVGWGHYLNLTLEWLDVINYLIKGKCFTNDLVKRIIHMWTTLKNDCDSDKIKNKKWGISADTFHLPKCLLWDG